MTSERFKPREHNQQDINNVQTRLRALKIGETMAYEVLTREVGFNVRHRRHPVDTARRRLWDERVFIAVVTGVGFQRVDDEGAAGAIDSFPRRIRRMARRAGKMSQAISPDHTKPETFQKVVPTAASLSVIDHLSSERSLKKQATLAANSPMEEHRKLMRDSIEEMRKG